jgi:FlaA1/EpsC-like NDP-sugar epimerase
VELTVADKHYQGKSVLVTGACGTVGAELTRQLIEGGAARVVCLDNNESELFFLQQQYSATGKVSCFLADVRDLDELTLRMQGIDIVLHAAALKHVPLCEESPGQALRTNVIGTQNVIDAAVANQVERVIFTSSDKAVNPTNVMGASKLMGERLVTAASQSHSARRTIFASTRFGNVLGSRGSVIPLFRRQIQQGGPITLTDPGMTRFIMTLEEAVALVLQSVWLAIGGEVFVTKMSVARIEDLALTMRDALGDERIEIKVVGAKPGEKMYEELMNEEEVRRAFEIDSFFVVLPAFVTDRESRFPYIRGRQSIERPYHSAREPALSIQELAAYLVERNLV